MEGLACTGLHEIIGILGVYLFERVLYVMNVRVWERHERATYLEKVAGMTLRKF